MKKALILIVVFALAMLVYVTDGAEQNCLDNGKSVNQCSQIGDNYE